MRRRADEIFISIVIIKSILKLVTTIARRKIKPNKWTKAS